MRWAGLVLVGMAMAGVTGAQVGAQVGHSGPPRFLFARTGTGPFVPIDSSHAIVLRRAITLDLHAVPIRAALDTIARRGGFEFVYRAELLPVRSVNLIAQDMTVAAALTDLLHDTDLDIVLRPDGVLTLVRRLAATNDSLTTRPVTGVVTDSANGTPIPEVNIVLKGTKVGTISKADGSYRLEAPNVPSVLAFYRIGYKARDIPLPAGVTSVQVALAASTATLSAVQVTAQRLQQPVAHTSELAVVQEIKSSMSVVSGISSEQIAKQADINAAQIVRHISGVTVRDESFLVVRGMSQRYNATYIDDNLAPSTEQYSRAFDLSLIPDRIIDRILVYKSPRPDLYADMTGGAVKIFTKDALAIRRLEVSLRLGDRVTTTGRDMLTYSGGSTDWLGIDDGTRALPGDVPPFGSFRHATLTQSQYVSSMSPVLGPKTVAAPPDGQLTINYYDNWRLGRGVNLYNVSSGSYTLSSLSSSIYEQQGATQIPSQNQSQYGFYQQYNNWTERDARGSQSANLNLMENLTLRVGDHHQLYFKNFVLQQGTSTTLDQIREPNDSLGPPSTGQSGVGGTWTRNIILSWEQRFVYQGNLGGVHTLTPDQSLAWNVGYTASLHSTPDQRTARFVDSTAYYPNQPSPYPNTVGTFNNNWQPLTRFGQVQGGPYAQTGTISRIWTRNDEDMYNGSVDYTASPASWADVKVGTYDFFKSRTVDRRAYLVEDGEMAQLGSTTPGDGGGNYSYPGTQLYVNPNLLHYSPGQLNSIWNSTYFPNNMTGWAVVDHTLPTDAYQANERYDAGYAMATLKPFNGHLEIVGGLRVEYDQIRLAAAEWEGGGFEPTIGLPALPLLIHRQTTSWLPSANVAWRPSDLFVLRAAYGKTVNRPEFREMAPFADYNYVDNTIITGNPEVVQASIDNYDVRFEVYPRSGDVFSVGAFYKSMRNAIEQRDQAVTSNFAGVTFPEGISFGNAPTALVEGIELEARTRLFWNLSFAGSGAVIHSRATASPNDTIPSGNRPLQGQAPYIVDVGLYYNHPTSGTQVSATFNQSGTSIYAVGATGPRAANQLASGNTTAYRGSILELPRGLLEMAITQTSGPWRFKLSAQNLLNAGIRFAQDENFDAKYEPEHLATVQVPTDIGGSVVNVPERQYVGDNIYRRFNPGRYFLLTIMRSF